MPLNNFLSPCHPQPWQPPFYFLYVNWTISDTLYEYNCTVFVFFFFYWLISLRKMSLKFIMLQHVPEFTSFLRLIHISSCVCTTFCLSIHLSMNSQIASAFFFFPVAKYLQDPAFNSFGHILRSGISGSSGNPIFKTLRNLVHKGSNFSISSPTFIYLFILTVATLMGMQILSFFFPF